MEKLLIVYISSDNMLKLVNELKIECILKDRDNNMNFIYK